MHHHKLSLTICDYEQLISIGYKYNQFKIDDVRSEERRVGKECLE